MSMLIRCELSVHGNVQGVFYRAFAKEHATRLHVVGWARNAGDHVEIVAEGGDGAVGKLLEQLRLGPGRAMVERIEIQKWPIGKKTFRSFSIRQ